MHFTAGDGHTQSWLKNRVHVRGPIRDPILCLLLVLCWHLYGDMITTERMQAVEKNDAELVFASQRALGRQSLRLDCAANSER